MGPFFKDLTNPAYATPFAIYHRRFSTNTTPKWPLAQPMRVLGHNGALGRGVRGLALGWRGGRHGLGQSGMGEQRSCRRAAQSCTLHVPQSGLTMLVCCAAADCCRPVPPPLLPQARSTRCRAT